MANQERLPDFLIIGAMRSGTTALRGNLQHHPGIFMARPKELNFFDRNYDKGIHWYLEHFDGVPREQKAGEATPSYMYWPEVPPRMAELVPKAKLVCILRNPVDRAYSHYWLSRANEKEHLSFEHAIERELGGPVQDRVWHSYLDRGNYVRQINQVLDFYPRNHLYVALTEEMRQNPAVIFSEVCAFVGVDPSYLPPDLDRDRYRLTVSRSLLLRKVGNRLPGILRRPLARLNGEVRGYPPMRPETRTRLLNYFSDSNAALAVALSRNLSIWSN